MNYEFGLKQGRPAELKGHSTHLHC